MTVKNPAADSITRSSTYPRCPATMSPMRNGVARMAWYVRVQMNPPSTGYVDSLTATCMAVEASNPGAM